MMDSPRLPLNRSFLCLLLTLATMVPSGTLCGSDLEDNHSSAIASNEDVAVERGNSATNEPSELIRARDRVAWVGGRLWEQMQERCDLESILAVRLAGKEVTFRNVAWSGDDVEGRARAVFGSLEDGYQRRLTDLKNANPTVVFLAYGQSEAIDFGWTIERFNKGLLRLIGDLKKAGYRIVLLPPTQIPSGTRFPSNRLQEANRRIEQFANSIVDIGKSEGCTIVRLSPLEASMTRDGIQPHPLGYVQIARRWADALVPVYPKMGPSTDVTFDVDSLPLIYEDGNWKLEWENDAAGSNVWRWKESAKGLPEESLQSWTEDGVSSTNSRKVRVAGLKPGKYRLSVEGQTVAEGNEKEWAEGLDVRGFGVDRQREALQKLIVDKEMQFMHRYRPQNETYLFLFRKHEQGNNAGEVDRFAELTSQSDTKIQELSQPKSFSWELYRVD